MWSGLIDSFYCRRTTHPRQNPTIRLAGTQLRIGISRWANTSLKHLIGVNKSLNSPLCRVACILHQLIFWKVFIKLWKALFSYFVHWHGISFWWGVHCWVFPIFFCLFHSEIYANHWILRILLKYICSVCKLLLSVWMLFVWILPIYLLFVLIWLRWILILFL